MMLMPVPGLRRCRQCEHSWFTSHLASCACPACGELQIALLNWPHVCASGHSASHGGDCAACVRIVEAKQERVTRAESRERRNR